METAAWFDRAGFEPHDVHMTDLLAGHRTLAPFKGLVACGGFSYGDVLGAGVVERAPHGAPLGAGEPSEA